MKKSLFHSEFEQNYYLLEIHLQLVFVVGLWTEFSMCCLDFFTFLIQTQKKRILLLLYIRTMT